MRLFATLLAGFLVAVPLVAQDTAEPLKATRRYAAVGLDRYQTKDGEQTFVDVIGGRSPRDMTEVPITGSVVTASVDYVDVGVKSGQTIRLYARERGEAPWNGGAPSRPCC
jgi:hypothetical protein